MKKYAHIIFTHDYQDEEVDRLMNKEYDFEALARHLSQWDTGEYNEIRDVPGAGTSDDCEEYTIEGAGTYLLSWNIGLGYVGLEAIIETEI